jgi:hypothetical protein
MELSKEAINLLYEAGGKEIPLAPVPNGQKFDAESSPSSMNITLSRGSGYVFLGNHLKATINYTITGRKGGVAKKEDVSVPMRTGQWLTGWDTGPNEIIIIQSSGQTYTCAPFWGACNFCWSYND